VLLGGRRTSPREKLDSERVTRPIPPSDAGSETAYGGAPAFRPAQREPLFTRTIPVSGELPQYRFPSVGRDLLAGVTVAALALPSAMAYGELAGLTPVNGLYCLLAPMIAYVLLGSSRQLIIGTEGSISTLVAASVLPLALAGSARAGELAGALALLVAGCFLIARLLKLGWLADYFSRPVLVGYIHGVAIVLVTTQLGKMLGLSISARDPLPRLWEVVRELGDVSGATVAVSACSLLALLLMRFFVPRLPGALIVVVAAISLSWAFDFQSHGIAVVGRVAAGLPDITVPTPAFGDWVKLAPAAVGIFLVSFAGEILTTRAFAGRHNQHIRASQELLAMAAANAAAGLTHAFSIGASGSRTAVNDSMGARTQFAGLFAAGTIVGILLFLTEPVQYLPAAVLGAVIVSAGIGLVDPVAWRALAAIDRVEVAIAAVTAGSVVAFGVLEALVVAVGLSIVDTVRRSARPYDAVLGWVPKLGRYADVSLHPSARITPGVVVYRLDDRLFFANARYVKGRVREAILAAPTETSWLVFDAEAVMHIDSTGMEALESLVRDLRRDGTLLVVARLRTRMRDEFEAAGLTDAIGPENFYASVEQAVAAFDAGRVESGRRLTP
jgi:sulfate permease, SulP family